VSLSRSRVGPPRGVGGKITTSGISPITMAALERTFGAVAAEGGAVAGLRLARCVRAPPRGPARASRGVCEHRAWR
jgi:hypothetical protein